LTVMAPGRAIHLEDLPEHLQPSAVAKKGLGTPGWQQQLAAWADDQLDKGGSGLADKVIPKVERILIDAALKQAQGQRGEAAKLLGWGRNTLTRKLKGCSSPRPSAIHSGAGTRSTTCARTCSLASRSASSPCRWRWHW